jgi:hypothetical protein
MVAAQHSNPSMFVATAMCCIFNRCSSWLKGATLENVEYLQDSSCWQANPGLLAHPCAACPTRTCDRPLC